MYVHLPFGFCSDAVSTAFVILPQEEAAVFMEQESADWDVLMLARTSAAAKQYRLITNMHPDECVVHECWIQ